MRINVRTIALVGIACVSGFVLSYIVFGPSHSTAVPTASATASFRLITPADQWNEVSLQDRDIIIERRASAVHRRSSDQLQFQWAEPLVFPPDSVAPGGMPAVPSQSVPARWVQPQMLQRRNLQIIERDPCMYPRTPLEHSTDLIDFRYQPDFRIDRTQ